MISLLSLTFIFLKQDPQRIKLTVSNGIYSNIELLLKNSYMNTKISITQQGKIHNDCHPIKNGLLSKKVFKFKPEWW